MSERPLFDADAIRSIERRTAFIRRTDQSTLVLGSTQDAAIVDMAAMANRGVELVRRRSGGGAVLVQPERAVWVDTWVPRADPLWNDDLATSSAWIGRWWAEALGTPDLEVHGGPPIRSRWADLICFAAVAAGEVRHRGRKVVGVAQWRGREGSFTHSLAYLGVDWAELTELLDLGGDRAEATRDLEATTVTAAELVGVDGAELVSNLVERLPDPGSWTIEGRA